MAISMENPQEGPSCHASSSSRRDSKDGTNKGSKQPLHYYQYYDASRIEESCGPAKDESNKPLRKKPSQTLLYLRHRANASNVSMVVVGVVLTVLSCHRLLSLYMTHRRWLNAPITYMNRQCPPPSTYPTLEPIRASETTVCITTLTDNKSHSLFQRFIRWRNYDGILELTWPNKLKYARKHGYVLYDGSALIDTARPPAWSKILAVQHLLGDDNYNHHSNHDNSKNAVGNSQHAPPPQQQIQQQQQQEYHCDWIMWADADTVFMNSDVRVQDFLPSDDTDVDFLIGSDDGGGYNSGVFVLRNSDWSRNFMRKWWDMESYVRPPGFSLSGDNYALKALLRDMPSDEFTSKIGVPPRCTLNSFARFLTLGESVTIMDHLTEQEWYMSNNYYHKSDFIAHAPGYDNKAECIRLLLQEAK